MPRVLVKTKNRAGAKRKCGKCGREILPGERYRTWSFRYGGARFRCYRAECVPRPSDLTQSKMADVYSAIEDAEGDLKGADSAEAVRELVDNVVEVVRDVSQEYADAAEQFGGQGENQDRADDLDGWADELDALDLDEDDDLEDVRDEARDALGGCPL